MFVHACRHEALDRAHAMLGIRYNMRLPPPELRRIPDVFRKYEVLRWRVSVIVFA